MEIKKELLEKLKKEAN